MYLAREEAGPRLYRYILRESYRDGALYRSRDLADLGPDPGRCFVYSGETAFHLDETFLSDLKAQGLTATYAELEELLFPFLDPYLKNRLQPFRHRKKYRDWQPASEQLRQRAMDEIHAFDRRRLHFLRLGRASLGQVDKAAVLYTQLLEKSRDEIEQCILAQEQALPPREHHNYLFAMFDLQRFFTESYARSIPQALDRNRLDSLFLQELCLLADDESFWQGYPRTNRLPASLVRYLIMYFDTEPLQTETWSRYGQRRASRRYSRNTAYADTNRVSRTQAMVLFGLKSEDLASLTKKELTRLYRVQAQKLHPDKGGDSEDFIRITAAYEELAATLP